jgi:hypothetical protein
MLARGLTLALAQIPAPSVPRQGLALTPAREIPLLILWDLPPPPIPRILIATSRLQFRPNLGKQTLPRIPNRKKFAVFESAVAESRFLIPNWRK